MGVSLAGIGAVTSYGWGVNDLWSGALSSRTAIRRHDRYGEYDNPFLALVHDPDPSSRDSLYTRVLKYIVQEALEDAKSRGWKQTNKVALIHSSVYGDDRAMEDFHKDKWNDHEFKLKYAYLMPSTIANRIARAHNFNGPFLQINSMCASGSAAILHAKMLIDCGIVDSALVLNGDVCGTPKHLKGFTHMGVVNPGVCPEEWSKPFQEDTRGLIGAEGAVAMLLTKDDADGYYDILGGAMTNDAFSLTRIDPSYTQLRRCIEEGLLNAKVESEQVSTYNSHGPGTSQCNMAEKFLVETYFKDAQVYSFKPLVGHCMSAAAGVELVLEAMSQKNKLIPAPKIVSKPIINNLLDGPTDRKSGIGAKVSIGLGGTNTVLLLDAA